MIVYWITTITSYLFAKAHDYSVEHRISNSLNSRTVERIALLGCFLTLVIVTGFRWQVGADYLPYERYFYQVAYGEGQGRFEIGYFFLNILCASISDRPRVLFVASSIIFFSFTFAAIKRMSVDCALSVFLLIGCGYFFSFMNGMRQLIAAAIVLFAVSTLNDRRLGHFGLLVLLASTFHLSALICLIIPILKYLTITKKSLIGLVICGVIFISISESLASFSAEVFGYSDYLSTGSWQASTGYMQVLINACILIFGLMMYYHGGRTDEVLKVCILMQIIALLLAITTGQVPLIQRVQQYFGFQQIILIPRALNAIQDRRLRWLIRYLIIIIYIVYIYITVGLWNSNIVLPYQWNL